MANTFHFWTNLYPDIRGQPPKKAPAREAATWLQAPVHRDIGYTVAPIDPPPTGILAYLRWMSCVKLLMGIMSHSSYASFMYAKSVKFSMTVLKNLDHLKFRVQDCPKLATSESNVFENNGSQMAEVIPHPWVNPIV